jgi:YgiT-type zinc finger domain-containing protein
MMKTCQNCHTGTLHPKSITYANWHAGQFITGPNMPAWQCDVCALCEVEAEALNRLLPLLGPVTRPSLTQVRREQPPRTAESTVQDLETDRDRHIA